MNQATLVRRHVEWWTDRVERRMLGNARHSKGHRVGPAKSPWDRGSRRRFLAYLWDNAPDFSGATDLADTFDRAVTEARGNPARFRHSLDRGLGKLGLT